MTTLPEGVGPHEGREFDLMRQGDKHVALFFELKPEGLDGFLAEGYKLLKFRQFTHEGAAYYTRIVYRPSHAKDAQRLQALVTENHRGIDPLRKHEIGKILGYTHAEVEAFLAHVSEN